LENVDWIHLAQNRDQWQSLVDTVMKYQVSWQKINFQVNWLTVSFSKRTVVHEDSYDIFPQTYIIMQPNYRPVEVHLLTLIWNPDIILWYFCPPPPPFWHWLH
jgi:hypothetical protein